MGLRSHTSSGTSTTLTTWRWKCMIPVLLIFCDFKPVCHGIPPLPAPSDSLLDKYPLWCFDNPLFKSQFFFLLSNLILQCHQLRKYADNRNICIFIQEIIQVNNTRHVFANSPLPQSSLGSFSQEVSATNLPGIFSTYLQIETNWDKLRHIYKLRQIHHNSQ